MLIVCVPLFERIYYCCECGCLMPFDGNNHCFACESDSPVGSLDDDTISEEQWELEQEPFHVIWNHRIEKWDLNNLLHKKIMNLKHSINKFNHANRA